MAHGQLILSQSSNPGLQTIIFFFSVWGHPMYGCEDHSDKVKNFNIINPSNPCGGNEYTYKDIFDEYTVPVDWECTEVRNATFQSGKFYQLELHGRLILKL